MFFYARIFWLALLLTSVSFLIAFIWCEIKKVKSKTPEERLKEEKEMHQMLYEAEIKKYNSDIRGMYYTLEEWSRPSCKETSDFINCPVVQAKFWEVDGSEKMSEYLIVDADYRCLIEKIGRLEPCNRIYLSGEDWRNMIINKHIFVCGASIDWLIQLCDEANKHPDQKYVYREEKLRPFDEMIDGVPYVHAVAPLRK